MALDIFLGLNGIEGNSRDANHPGWFEVMSFHSGMQRTAGAGDRSVVCLQDISLERRVDGASHILKDTYQSGQHFDSATIDVVKRGSQGAPEIRLIYRLSDCVLSSYKEQDKETEALSISFAHVEWRWSDGEGTESKAECHIPDVITASRNEIDVFGPSEGRAYETESDTFLRIVGVNGASSDPAHTGWHEVLSHRLTVIHEGNAEHWSNEHALVILKRVDRTSPELANACVIGLRFDSVTLEVLNLRSRRPLMIYHLTDCMISEYLADFQVGHTADSSSVDQLAISFKHMDWEHFLPADPDGAPVSRGQVKQGDDSVPSTAVIVPKSAFIVMWMDPERPELEDVHSAIVEVCERFGFSAVRADDIQHDERITDIILDKIRTSEIVIADLTGERPNVYYEIGHAHAMRKQPILIRRKGSPLHFDLAVHNVREYRNLTELRAILSKRLSSVHS